MPYVRPDGPGVGRGKKKGRKKGMRSGFCDDCKARCLWISGAKFQVPFSKAVRGAGAGVVRPPPRLRADLSEPRM